MNIILDEKTREALKANLEAKNKNAVRLMVKGYGWAGPSLGLVLDERGNNDDITTIDGITFVAEKDMSFLFEDVKVLYRKGYFGDSFDVYNTNNIGGNCGH